MSRPEKSKQTFVRRQEKWESWCFGYRKIGIGWRVNIVPVAEYSWSFSEKDWSAYQETSVDTSDFNQPGEGYVNYISTDLSAEMMSIRE